MIEIAMPRLSDSMEEGTLLRWLVADGAHVSRGDELAEVETDKATMPYEADADGRLHHVVAEGATLPVGATIALVLATGEVPPDGIENVPAAGRADDATGDDGKPGEPVPSPEGSSLARDGGAAVTARPKASPVARRVARDLDVDLSRLVGTGPGGRIVRLDVERAVEARAGDGQPPAVPATEDGSLVEVSGAGERVSAKGASTRRELSRVQQVVARRMAESRATIPDFTVTMDVDMEACVALRAEIARLGAETVPSYNDMVVKASALALRDFPRANASYRDGAIDEHGRVNIGIAVASEDSLVVPTVFDADRRSLGEIARETRRLAARVRAGSVTPPELAGSTFAVSNLGMYGVTEFTAVIDPPQAAILAVGAMAPRAVVREGQVVARPMLTLTLTSDHRVLYGADAASFLARIQALLEHPLSAFLGVEIPSGAR